MNIPIIDRSSYLKGLLIVARKSKKLTEAEKKIIRGIANKLGFAEDFYEETLRSLIANKYISDMPISFSDKTIAKSFIIDGLKLAFSDNNLSVEEAEWLKKTASANGIKHEWVNEEIKKLKGSPSLLINTEYALYSII